MEKVKRVIAAFFMLVGIFYVAMSLSYDSDQTYPMKTKAVRP